MRAAGKATRKRILTAARGEFAEHGLAGARINRIAAQARASKERLYAYFASKDELFAAVCADTIESSAADAQFSAEDVAGYVGRLFDVFAEGSPDIVRLYDRIALDGPRELDGFRSVGSQVYGAKVEEVRRGQRAGIIDPDWDPGVLLSMLIGTARSMARERALRGIDGTIYGRATLKERRAAAVKAAEKLISPTNAHV